MKTPLTDDDEARPKSVNRMYSLEGSFLKGPTSLFRKSMNLLKQVKVIELEDESLATKVKGVDKLREQTYEPINSFSHQQTNQQTNRCFISK